MTALTRRQTLVGVAATVVAAALPAAAEAEPGFIRIYDRGADELTEVPPPAAHGNE
jgi:hypothetical protein